MTVISVDVKAVCEKCGQPDKYTLIGHTKFCSICLSEFLVEVGVPVMEMTTIENTRDDSVYSYNCLNCRKPVDNTMGACPYCGYQEESDEEG